MVRTNLRRDVDDEQRILVVMMGMSLPEVKGNIIREAKGNKGRMIAAFDRLTEQGRIIEHGRLYKLSDEAATDTTEVVLTLGVLRQMLGEAYDAGSYSLGSKNESLLDIVKNARISIGGKKTW